MSWGGACALLQNYREFTGHREFTGLLLRPEELRLTEVPYPDFQNSAIYLTLPPISPITPSPFPENSSPSKTCSFWAPLPYTKCSILYAMLQVKANLATSHQEVACLSTDCKETSKLWLTLGCPAKLREWTKQETHIQVHRHAAVPKRKTSIQMRTCGLRQG